MCVRCRYPDLRPFWLATSMFCVAVVESPIGGWERALSPCPLLPFRSRSLGMKTRGLRVLYSTMQTIRTTHVSLHSHQA